MNWVGVEGGGWGYLLRLSCAGATSRQQELLCPLERGEGRLTGASCRRLPLSASPQLGHSAGTSRQKIRFWQWDSRITGPSMSAAVHKLAFFLLFTPVTHLVARLRPVR